jgi:hypothetical protein
MATYYFAANAYFHDTYVRAGSTISNATPLAVLPWYIEDLGTNQFGAALPAVLPPSGGGQLLGNRAIHLS